MMEQLITCITELEKLKLVERGIDVGDRKESTAEHSWSCMLIADILIDYVDERLDRLKVLEYLLYHDIVEVYAGDAKFNNPEEMRVKMEKEAAALKKIVSIVPNQQRFIRIIEEYEDRETRESQLAKAIDCIDSCVRNLNNPKKKSVDGFTEELIREKYSPHVSKFKFTHDLFELLMKMLKEQDKL